MSDLSQQKSSLFSIVSIVFPWVGWLGFGLCTIIFCITGCSQNTTMNQQSKTFHKVQLEKIAQTESVNLTATETKEALERFTTFLKGIGSSEYIEKEISNVYSKNAYLNDTLKSLHNLKEIKEHFLKTSKTMTSYSVEIEDIASTDQGHYIRWTMKFSAPKLASAKEIESIGMTYVMFDQEGRAVLHQDYWDSVSGMFEHVPIIGGGIRMIKKRL